MKSVEEIEKALPLRGRIVKAHARLIYSMNHDTSERWFDWHVNKIHEMTGIDHMDIYGIFYASIMPGTYKELFDRFRELGIYIPDDQDLALYRSVRKNKKTHAQAHG